jgi:hypothetical protein
MYDRRFGRGAVMDHRRGLPAVIVVLGFLAFPAGALAQDALGTVAAAATQAVPSVTPQVPRPAPAAPVLRQVPKPPPVAAPAPRRLASPADTVQRVAASVAPAASPAVHAVTHAVTPVAQPVEHAVRSLTGSIDHVTHRAARPVISQPTGIGRAVSAPAEPLAPAGAVLGMNAFASPATPAAPLAAAAPATLAARPAATRAAHVDGTGPVAPARGPSAPRLPGAPSGAMAGPAGVAAFTGFALMFAAVVLLPAGVLRRLRLAPAMVGPAPFVSLLERPG